MVGGFSLIIVYRNDRLKMYKKVKFLVSPPWIRLPAGRQGVASLPRCAVRGRGGGSNYEQHHPLPPPQLKGGAIIYI